MLLLILYVIYNLDVLQMQYPPSVWCSSSCHNSNVILMSLFHLGTSSNELVYFNLSYFGIFSLVHSAAIVGCILGLALLHRNNPFATVVWNFSALVLSNGLLLSILNNFSLLGVAAVSVFLNFIGKSYNIFWNKWKLNPAFGLVPVLMWGYIRNWFCNNSCFQKVTNFPNLSFWPFILD